MDNQAYENTEADVTSEEQRHINHRDTRYYESAAATTSRTKETNDELNTTVELKKTLGFFSSVAIVVGIIIGSGIFISPKGVLSNSGSVGLSLLIWLICGVISLLGCLAFAELGTLIPDTGGEYIYLLEAFAPERKERTSWWRPLIAFLQSFVMFFIKPAGLAIQGLTCGEYIVRIGAFRCEQISDYISPKAAVKCIAVCLILLITYINIYSVKIAARTQNFFTAAKVSALVLIILAGIVQLFMGRTEELSKGFDGSNSDFGSISAAFYSGLFAYAGWDNLNNVVKEMQNPQRDLLPAMMTSIGIVIVCYLFVNVSYLTGLTTDELLASDAVAVAFAGNVAGMAGAIIMIISVACSTFGSGNGGALTTGRVVYTAAREGHLPQMLSYIHINYFTPAPALLSIAIIALIMVIPSNVGVLISIAGFVDWIFMGLTMVALLVLRRVKKDVPRTVKVPLIVPVIVLVFSVFVVVTPFTSNPKMEHLYILAFILIGVALYFAFVYLRYKLPYLDKMSRFIQKITLSMPCEKEI